ncbi:protein-export chaperone SecB [Commensalibacter oyaizuii]|uniref:Protein-export chaperone SecB n=1 Tax=Commensalibacter oyaizuii TaxID=3043873 RepID=A0ABT6Q1P6_9PROT|nr:protein-export chaperone SecB [Commensalibacter sp. TBRC 16381]MDI2091033.1 protein-export chaperone SecB [Commensalibacter sp. TBRC 16381]
MNTKTQTPIKTELKDLTINTQYVKEISLKIPHAPTIFRHMPPSPQLTVIVDVNAQQLVENQPNFDVTVILTCKSTAQIEEDKQQISIFDIHLEYAGIVTFPHLDTSNLEELLMVHTPDILFPEIRNIIRSLSYDANLPPVILQRINFAQLWQEKKQSSKE